MIHYWDGFEKQDNGLWTLSGTFTQGSFEETGGRDGGALRHTDTHQSTVLGLDPLPAFAFGFAVKPEGIEWPIKLFRLWGYCNFTEIHGYEPWGGLSITQNGQLAWSAGTTTWPGEENWTPGRVDYMGTAIRAGVWTHIECHVYQSYIHLWVNGVSLGSQACDVMNMRHLSYNIGDMPHLPVWPAQIFQFGGASTWQRHDFPYVWFDDFYISNYPQDGQSIGDLAVKSYFPLADGSHLDWTPSTGTAHHDMIDEQPHDGDGTYIHAEEGDVGHIDSFTFDLGETSGTPLIAAPIIAARKNDIGPRAARILTRLGAAEVYSDPFWLYSDWPLTEYHHFPAGMERFDIEHDPNDDDWTWETLADAEFGIEIYL